MRGARSHWPCGRTAITPVRTITGIAAPLLRANVDTDTIIPSSEIRSVAKTGLADSLFSSWRYLSAETRELNRAFVLNQAPFTNSSILLVGQNFGCGSSREHAVWALHDWGIRAIIGPGFGSIFKANCIRNGLLPVVLSEAIVELLAATVLDDPLANQISLDLQEKQITLGSSHWMFEFDDNDRAQLLSGMDAIDRTLEYRSDIEAFEQQDRVRRPWAYL
jgi:3-isopropylmalate/(R)-2-methylmalate dehydratase small subunit